MMSARFKTLVAVSVGCAVALLAFLWFSKMPAPSRLSTLNTALRPATSAAIPAFVRSLRPIYPYSVIPGGVFSQQELKARLESDRVARLHFAGFDLEHTRLVRLTQDRLQYVSYRVGDQVFWTLKPLRIPSGEVLLTDGRHFARTRCGNLLSGTPSVRTFATERTTAIDLPPISEKSLGDQSIQLLRPPDIDIPATLPPQLTDIFAMAPVLGYPAPLSRGVSSSVVAMLGTGAPPLIFASPLLASKKSSGATPVSIPIQQPGQPPVQPPVPLGVLIPEPRFAFPIGVAALWVLSVVVRLRKPLRRRTLY